MEMPFGKHKGEELEDIPVSYLRWVLRTVDLFDDELRQEIEDIVGEKATAPKRDPGERGKWNKQASGNGTYAPPPPTPPRAGFDINGLHRDLIDAVNRFRRSMAGKFHPDRGHDTIILQAINDGIDRVMKEIDSAVSIRTK
jgi:hypothetical protein